MTQIEKVLVLQRLLACLAITFGKLATLKLTLLQYRCSKASRNQELLH